MRSRIHALKEYTQVDMTPFQRTFVPDEDAIAGELQRLRNRGIRWTDGTAAAAGDAAVCRLESENPRFCKSSVHIALGAGMLPNAIEQAVVGMQVGQCRQAEVDGQVVTVTLLSVKNKHLPELTDAWIAGMGIDGVFTLEQYRARLIREQKQERARFESYDAAQAVLEQVRQETEFILCQSDWQAVVDLNMARNSELCRQDGLDIKTMTAEDFRGRIPATCYDGVVSLVKTNAWRTLQNYLLGRHYAALEGFTVDEAGYEAYIHDYQKTWRVSEENARLSNTYEHYCVNSYAAYFVDKVMAYVCDHYYLE